MPEQSTSTEAPSASGVPLVPAPPEIEQTIERLSAHKTVRGVLICARDGPVIRSNGGAFEGERGRKYAAVVKKIVDAVKDGLGEVDEQSGDEVRFMRIRTKKHEIMITPDEHYLLVVLQDPGQ